MKKILHIISSSRGKNSYSVQLGKAIINKLRETMPESIIIERNLVEEPPPFLSETQIQAFYKAPEHLSSNERTILAYSDTVVNEIQEADVLVIGVPMHNLGISAPLKAWIDQMVRINVSVKPGKNKSNLRTFENKKAYLAIASGRIHNAEKALDFIEPYLKNVLKTVGIVDVYTAKVAGTAQPDFTWNDYEIIMSQH